MPHVDFFITNPKHHVEAALPVIETLRLPPYGYTCRVVSLCEFRGFLTPTDQFADIGVPVVRVVPFQFRSPSSSVSGGQAGRDSWLPRQVRSLIGTLLIWRLRYLFRTCHPEAVVLPNDAAYPNARICRLLHALGIPFVLMQEGIRFSLPGVAQTDAYGRGGATAIAAWGAASAAYFKAQGVPEETIRLTGSPRFDSIRATDWQKEAAAVKAQHGWQRPVLLFLSNPIDDQGFCSTQEKLDLVAEFMAAAMPALEARNQDLVIKLHPRESVERFQEMVHQTACRERVHVVQQVSLYALFPLAKAAVVLASTTGLEALLFGVPIGVLEIPGTGFVYDYVSSGAAKGLHAGVPLAKDIEALLQQTGTDGPAERYLAHNFARLGQSAAAVCEVIQETVEQAS